MPLRKIKRKFRNVDILREHFFWAMALVCIFVGYLIVMMNRSGEDLFVESTETKNSFEGAEDRERMKERIEKNPEFLKTFRSEFLQK